MKWEISLVLDPTKHFFWTVNTAGEAPHCNKILLEPKKQLYKQKKKESKQKRLYKPEQGEKQNLAKEA